MRACNIIWPPAHFDDTAEDLRHNGNRDITAVSLAANGTPENMRWHLHTEHNELAVRERGTVPETREGQCRGVGPGSRVCAANPGIRRSGPPATKAPACVLHTGTGAGRIGDGAVSN